MLTISQDEDTAELRNRVASRQHSDVITLGLYAANARATLLNDVTSRSLIPEILNITADTYSELHYNGRFRKELWGYADWFRLDLRDFVTQAREDLVYGKMAYFGLFDGCPREADEFLARLLAWTGIEEPYIYSNLSVNTPGMKVGFGVFTKVWTKEDSSMSEVGYLLIGPSRCAALWCFGAS